MMSREEISKWSTAWQREGFNHVLDIASKALTFLAENPRPSGGEQHFNSEHCHQLAHELKIAKHQLMEAVDERNELKG